MLKRVSSILVFVLIVFQYACKEQNSYVKKKPNVVFILVDDLGLIDLGVTGSRYYETPNIDKLAKQGMIFTQGYAASRVCSPSRASIMTGKFTARHGITDWIGAKSGVAWRKHKRYDKLLPAEYVHNLPEQDISLAEAMKIGGYNTFYSGKWHLGNEGSYPENHGFEINVGGWDKGSPIGGYFSPWDNPKLENRVDGEPHVGVQKILETGQDVVRGLNRRVISDRNREMKDGLDDISHPNYFFQLKLQRKTFRHKYSLV